LHIRESLASIDFEDFEPAIISSSASKVASATPLVDCPLFELDAQRAGKGESVKFAAGKLRIIGMVHGWAKVSGGNESVEIKSGEFCLIPASLKQTEASFESDSSFLDIGLGT